MYTLCGVNTCYNNNKKLELIVIVSFQHAYLASYIHVARVCRNIFGAAEVLVVWFPDPPTGSGQMNRASA